MFPPLDIYELRKENLSMPQETRIYLWHKAHSTNHSAAGFVRWPSTVLFTLQGRPQALLIANH